MTKLVTGIGGFFFRSQDPKALGEWYDEHFGINSMQRGWVWKQEEGPTVFAPFKADTTYYPPGQQCMLNLRVTDLDALLEQLGKAGVRIDEDRQTEAFGKFAWVYDPEGNKIELWEPSPESEWNVGSALE
jgi:glyoxylase I family protein